MATPPSQAPTIPLVIGRPTGRSITVQFDVAGITGTTPITYSVLYGTTTNPTTVGSATLVSGTTYQAVISGLSLGTTYYIKSVATNSVDTRSSSAMIAETDSEDTVIGNNPPSQAPTIPLVIGRPTGRSITVRFDVAGITGDLPITYSILYGTSTNPTTVGSATLISGTTYQAVISGLSLATTYYIKSVATNSVGTRSSSATFAETDFIDTVIGNNPPSQAPTSPILFGTPTNSSITVRFDVAGITGDLPITYSILYGTSTNPTTVGSATLVSGTTYQAVISGLSIGTTYYIKSVATNSVGIRSSPVRSISTSAYIPISKSPSTPTLFKVTSTSITIRFNVKDITGSFPITYSILYGTTINPTTVGDATFIIGKTYQGIINGLIPNTTYYFKSVATNPAGIISSNNISVISTIGPPSKAPTTPIVFGTPSTTSITTRFDTEGITGTLPIRYSILYGTTTNPTTVGSATRIPNSLTIYEAVLNGLTLNTTYYIKSVAKNSRGNKSSSSANIKTALSTIPPSQAPTTPTLFGSATNTSITVRFDVAGITGSTPITYSVLYGTTTNPTTVGTATLVSGTIYQAVLNNLTTNNTYYIKSVATNSASTRSSTSYSEYIGEKLTYRAGKLNTYSISGFIPNVPLHNLVIPSSYNGSPVLTIDASAFENCTQLTGTLTITDGVLAINDGAFSGCTGLTGTLYIPDSIDGIGKQIFFGCTGLTGTLTIPGSIQTISDGAFQGCTGFTGLQLRSGLITISDGAFQGCTGFTGTLEIPRSVVDIGIGAFRNCSGFSLFTLERSNSIINLQNIDDEAFYGCINMTGQVTVTNGVPTIGSNAFQNTGVTIYQERTQS